MSINNSAMIDPRSLIPHPDRGKAGTTLAEDDGKYQFIRESIEDHGIEDAIKVQSGTNVIIGGHTRHRIALQLALAEVPVTYYDVDDDTARYMMAVDNHKRIGDEQDPMKLAWTFKVVVERSRGESLTDGQGLRENLGYPEDTLNSGSEPMTAQRIASFFGIKRNHLFKYLSLSRLIPALQLLVSQQKIGVSAGAILARGLSSAAQEKVFQTITPEAFDPDFRLTENEAKNYVEVYKSKDTPSANEEGDAEADATGGLSDLGPLFHGGDDANEHSFESDDADEEPGPWTVTRTESGGFSIRGGDDRMLGDELQTADDVLSEPERKKYLDQAQHADEAHAVTGDVANELYNAARDVTRMVNRIDDEDGRVRFARNQLEAGVKRILQSIRKVDTELVPLRVLVADDIDEENDKLWQEFMEQMTRLADKVRAVGTAANLE